MNRIWKSRLEVFAIIFPIHFGLMAAFDYDIFADQWLRLLLQSLVFAVIMMFFLGNSKITR